MSNTRSSRTLLVVLAIVLGSCGSSTETTSTADATTRAESTTATGDTTSTVSSSPTPSASAEEFTVLVIGDFGDSGDGAKESAAAIEAYASQTTISAFVTTGDNLYTDDADHVWHDRFGWVAASGIPVYAAWGNHDIETPRREAVVNETFHPPGRWYETDLGSARLIVLDANQVEDPDQQAWLEATLATPHDGPLIVDFHQPALSCANHGSTDEVIERWVPLFEANGVDLVINGHDHVYERFEHRGLTYVVAGAGGRSLYDMQECPDGTPEPTVAYNEDLSFVVLHIAGDVITGEALSISGDTIDRFSVSPQP